MTEEQFKAKRPQLDSFCELIYVDPDGVRIAIKGWFIGVANNEAIIDEVTLSPNRLTAPIKDIVYLAQLS